MSRFNPLFDEINIDDLDLNFNEIEDSLEEDLDIEEEHMPASLKELDHEWR